MAMEIFKLVGNIFVDNEKANKSIKDTDKKGQKLGETFKKGITTVGKWGVAVGGAAVAAGGAMFAAAEKVAATTDRVDKLSQRLGLSREGFQEWEFVLSQSGSSMESLQSGMKVMVQKIDDLKKGAGPGAEALGKLGIKAQDLADLSQEDAFGLIVQRFNEMPDGMEKAALAQDIFSRSGQELLPLLNSSAEAVEGMKNQANDLGLVMSDDMIDAGVVFTDSLDQMKRSLSAVGVQVVGGIMPIFNTMMQWIIDKMPMIREVFGKAWGAIETAVFGVFNVFQTYLLPVLQNVWSWIQTFMPQIRENAGTAFDMISEAAMTFWGILEKNVIPIIKQLWEIAKELFPVVKKIATEAFDIIKDAMQRVWEAIQDNLLPIFDDLRDAVQFVLEWVQERMPQIQSIFETAWDIIKIAVEAVIAVFEITVEILGTLWEYVRGPFSEIGKFIISAFGGVIDFLDGLIGTVRTVVDWFGRAISKVRDFVTAERQANTGNIGGRQQLDGSRASGGPVSAGHVYQVNEEGMEMFIPGRSGVIVPAAQTRMAMAGAGGPNINFYITGNTLLTDDDVATDNIGSAIVGYLRRAGIDN